MLMLAPRSHKAWSKYWIPIEHEIMGHPGSFFLGKLSMVAVHSSISLMTSVDGRGHLLLMMSLMYLV
jgi:hypothetical protein